MAKRRTRKASQQSQVKRSTRWLAVVVAAIVVIVAAFAISRLVPAPAAAGDTLPSEVSVAEAVELREQGAFVLDVREPSEWNELHVPDSTHIPLGQLASRLQEVPKDQPVVVICRSGNRSAQGRDILLNAGFTNVTSIRGGINDWRAQGQPTVSGQ